MYKDLLSQEAVTTYVIEKTEDSYSEDFIEELYTKTFGSSVLQDGKISPKQFAKFTTVSFAAGNVGVKIHVETKDRAFSDNLMKIYTDYINGSVKDIGDKITVDCISELVSEKGRAHRKQSFLLLGKQNRENRSYSRACLCAHLLRRVH